MNVTGSDEISELNSFSNLEILQFVHIYQGNPKSHHLTIRNLFALHTLRLNKLILSK